MTSYLIRRLLLIIPTLLGIMIINFAIIQAAPGGPVEQMIAKIRGADVSSTARISGSSSDGGQFDDSGFADTTGITSKYQGAQGLDPEFIAELEKMYGFDKPPLERFLIMITNYIQFDFGESYFKDRTVIELILEKMPVSISLGLWATLIIYFISIPMGIRKAVHDGSRFDVWTSAIIIVGYAIPSFLFAVLLIILFAGGSYWSIFPMRGIVSDNWSDLSLIGKVLDYFWHMALPVTALVIGGFATLTLLTKNMFLEEINKQYVITARAKGLTEKKILFGHIFRNAMLLIVAGMPAALLNIFFAGSLLIEVIFSLDGLGYLGYDSALQRDYPVVFGTLFIFTIIGLILQIISDITYTLIDPRIDFDKRAG